MTLSDNELWSASKDNRESFSNLFRSYYPVLLQYGRKFCMDTKVLEDCIQELFIDLWQSGQRVQVRSVKAYLLKALKYKIYRHYRDTEKIKTNEITDDLSFVLSHENFLIDQHEDRQKTEKVLNAVQQLSNREREIIYLRLYQKLSYEEIVEVMQINYQAARNLFYQAIKSLRKGVTSL
jgi:RNA polymerase sigma factor (sigma-70 family)